MEERLPRKLVAILYADVAGYSRLTGQDEDATHRTLTEYLDLIASTIESHRGQVMHYAGDAVLAQFTAVVDALSSAVAIQNELQTRNEALPDERKVRFRIGVNSGDVIEDRGDIYGDGVNVAARLESLAEPGGICISESVRTATGKKLPLDYEFMGEQTVKNIAEPVRAYRVLTDTAQTKQRGHSEHADLKLPDKPSIAVLPFTNMSGDREQEYFSDGVTEDIMTQLSKFRSLFVIARNSSFVYKGRAVRVQDVGRELGVAYIVEGSVRRSGERIRVTAQLVETATGKHIWAERYDRDLEDIFVVQDELTQTIAATVGGRVAAEGWQRARVSRTNVKAYDLILKGQALHFRVLKEANREARTVLEQALKLDPDNARAHALLGAVHLVDYGERWSEDLDVSLQLALRHGKRSVQLDDTDSQAHAHLGETLLDLGKLDEARVHFERAVTLNPADIVSRALYSLYFYAIGRAGDAIEQLSTVQRLDPFELSWIPWFRGIGYYLLHRYEEAIESLMRVNEPINDVRRWLAASYAQTGRIAEARALLEEYLTSAEEEMPSYPGQRFETWEAFWRKEYVSRPYSDHLCEGLRKAWPSE
ncbi:MAG: adenylate/guanylate cyclase domain-containing protein [Acidiferrobacterales bacterium]